MATPMQYELIGKLMQMTSDVAFLRKCPDVAASNLLEMREAVMQNVPLIDCTNVYKAIEDDSKSDETGSYLNGRVGKFLRPFEYDGMSGDPMYPMAFDRALFTLQFRAEQVSLWMVHKHDSAPGFCYRKYVVYQHKGSYGVSPFHDDMRDPEVPATRVAIALAAAKNAQWVETTPDRASRRRHPSIAGVRFRHIEIDMGTPKRRGASDREASDAGVPWHHRRGHWAYYGPDKPLFGRKGADGWYWRPYTEVGDKAHGEIVQDYSVVAPEVCS